MFPTAVNVAQISFQCRPRRFHRSVIETITNRSVRRFDLVIVEPVRELDGGVLGGFNRSSQHFEMEVVDGQASRMDGGVDGAVADEVAWGAFASA